jgi:hypothetical protein
VKKLMGWATVLIAFSLLGCDILPVGALVAQDAVGTSIGFSFGRLLVSSLLSLTS